MNAAKRTIAAIIMAATLLACGGTPLTFAAAPFASTANTTEARDAANAARRSLGLQTDMPGKRQQIKPEVTLPPAEGTFTAIQVTLWAALIIFLGVLALTLRDTIWSDSRSQKLRANEDGDTAPVATAARMEEARVEADVLARQGGFGEAMHVLLLQSVNELRRRLDISIAASLTSREILHRVGLPPEGKAFFADIISRVEISWFGAHEPDENDYLACRKSFEALTGILSRGGAA